jgi:hypothetical protein
MERNDDLSGTGLGGSTGSTAGSTGGSTGGAGFGNSGDISGTSGYGSLGGSTGAASANVGNIGSTTGAGTGTAEGSTGLKDRARDIASSAGERLADVGSTVRERAGTAKNSLADMLDAGADRLRGRAESTTATGADGTLAVADSGKMGQVNDRLASGMQSAANVLRDTDWDGIRTGVERQVKENPGRSLLVAVGLGYLLGKALRR